MPLVPATDPAAWRARLDAAGARIDGHVRRTELRAAQSLGAELGLELWLKLENRQITGSFKLRGATNAIALLEPAQRARGVVTASSGNHGKALAHAAMAAGTRAFVFVSSLVPANKLAALREMGAETRVAGASQDEAEERARAFSQAEDRVFISPFDDPAVIAGQGTIGDEMLDDLPDMDTVLVPLSGGGLAGGIAAAVKSRLPSCRIVGVSMARGPAMAMSITAGHPVEVAEEPTLADALSGGIGLDNRYTFAMVRDLLDDIVLLSEVEIAEGIRVAARLGETVEGGGGVGLAALVARRARGRGKTVIVLSGGNIDPSLHRRIVAGGSG